MPTTVFLAGASGAIGRRLVPLLVEAGYAVFGTTRSPEKADDLASAGITPVVVDVFDTPALSKAVVAVRPTVVIHQLTDLPRGLDPSRMAQAAMRNARIRDEGTRNLIAAALAAVARRLIAQSIAWVYAPGPEPHGEADPLDLGAKTISKASIDGVAALERQTLNSPLLEGIVLRYGALYGSGTGTEGIRVSNSGARGIEQGAAHGGPAMGGMLAMARLATLAGDRGETGEGGDLLAREMAEFGQISDQGAGRDRADALDRTQQALKLCGLWIGGDALGECPIDSGKAGGPRLDDDLQTGAHLWGLRQRCPAALSLQVVAELAATRGELAQDLVAEDRRPQAAAHQLLGGEAGNQPGVDAIGLGLESAAFAIGDDIIGMDADEQDGPFTLGGAERPLIAAGRLEGDQARRLRSEPGRHRLRRVGDALAGRRPGIGHVEPLLATLIPTMLLSVIHPSGMLNPLVGTPDCIRAKSPFYRARVRP